MTGITIDTDYPISISTDRPVSITSEGGTTTLRIGASPGSSAWTEQAEREEAERTGLARVPRAPRAAEALIPEAGPSRPRGPRCGVIMKRSRKPCARIEGHNGNHMTAQQIKNKQDYNKNKARERYAEDPEYADKIKAASRDSYARRTGGPDTE